MSISKFIRIATLFLVILTFTQISVTGSASSRSIELSKMEEIKSNQADQQGININSEVIQHKAYTHLEVETGVATLSAMFTHPENANENVRIRWFLYGWNEGSDTKIGLHPVDNQVTDLQQVVS